MSGVGGWLIFEVGAGGEECLYTNASWVMVMWGTPPREQVDTYETRMHSSRMRTGRSLTVCWRLLHGGGSAPGGVSQHALRQTPLPPPRVDRITDACKNITLAQLRCGR